MSFSSFKHPEKKMYLPLIDQRKVMMNKVWNQLILTKKRKLWNNGKRNKNVFIKQRNHTKMWDKSSSGISVSNMEHCHPSKNTGISHWYSRFDFLPDFGKIPLLPQTHTPVWLMEVNYRTFCCVKLCIFCFESWSVWRKSSAWLFFFKIVLSQEATFTYKICSYLWRNSLVKKLQSKHCFNHRL
jgi:hypothetical protein